MRPHNAQENKCLRLGCDQAQVDTPCDTDDASEHDTLVYGDDGKADEGDERPKLEAGGVDWPHTLQRNSQPNAHGCRQSNMVEAAHLLDGGDNLVTTAAVQRAYGRDEQDDVNEGTDGLVEEELHEHVPVVALALVDDWTGAIGPFLLALFIFCLARLFLVLVL